MSNKEAHIQAVKDWLETKPKTSDKYEVESFIDYLENHQSLVEIAPGLTLDVVNIQGCHADGQELEYIIQIGDVFYAVTSIYSSWDSSYWEDEYNWKEVKLVTKTIEVYE